MKKFFVLSLFLLLVGACSEAEKNPQRELSPLSFSDGEKRINFQVETSLSLREQALGLMFRKKLTSDRGMIFTFSKPKKTAFWMKNTYIPLDLIFVNAQNRISGIAENAQPLSEKLIYSPAQTIAVIELKAGTAQKNNLHRGMTVEHFSLQAPAH